MFKPTATAILTSTVHTQRGPTGHERIRPALEEKLEGSNVGVVLDNAQHTARIGEVLVDVVGQVALQAARVPGENARVVVRVDLGHAAGEGDGDWTQVHRVVGEWARLHAAAAGARRDPERSEASSGDVHGGLVSDEVAISGHGCVTAVEYRGGV